ncbi:hypothetical protein E4T56_gene9032 [Termitomyces sp. T112]|nr:hypothetical protein E4T56_gene9032 [Termitomyces sp. T112]
MMRGRFELPPPKRPDKNTLVWRLRPLGHLTIGCTNGPTERAKMRYASGKYQAEEDDNGQAMGYDGCQVGVTDQEVMITNHETPFISYLVITTCEVCIGVTIVTSGMIDVSLNGIDAQHLRAFAIFKV